MRAAVSHADGRDGDELGMLQTVHGPTVGIKAGVAGLEFGEGEILPIVGDEHHGMAFEVRTEEAGKEGRFKVESEAVDIAGAGEVGSEGTDKMGRLS